MLEIIQKINGFLWNIVLIILLCGTGVYFTIKLKFIQITGFKEGIKTLFGKQNNTGESKKSEMTPLQSLSTAIAAQIGTGNLAGAATALVAGGPGAIFWMWLSAFFGMATIYSEASLAQKYKKVINGEVTGGPIYYIQEAFKGRLGKIIAVFFSICLIIALGVMSIMIQSNSVSMAFSKVFSTDSTTVSLTIGILMAICAFIVFLGGTQRLANVVEKIVPFMALIYIVGSLIVIGMHITELPMAIKSIFVGAFNPSAVLGATTGVLVRDTIRYGIARGLFSNEAGMGSTPHAHARAKVENPHKQGLTAMISVFIDTFIILNLTVFSILTTGAMSSGKKSIALAQEAFVSAFGNSGYSFIAICLLFFAFSTILSYHFFGAVNVKYLFGEKKIKIYSLVVILAIILGSVLDADLIWELTDLFNAFIVIPNVLALLALSKVVHSICKKYSTKKD